MNHPLPASDASDRVELVLGQIDGLPTLSAVAVRILELTGDREADTDEIIQLIASDPALSSKLLSLCRRADRGLNAQVQTVERAVVMLGMDAVRCAVLSFEVFEALSGGDAEAEAVGDDDTDGPQPYDRRALWRYLLATATAAELLAKDHQPDGSVRVRPEEAFVCGLLHDLGKLALDRILPKSWARAAKAAEQRQQNIAVVVRQSLGVDPNTAGRRLAEHWRLPLPLQDVIWLNGQSPAALPDLEHRPLIALVTAAAEVARSRHIGWSGNFAPIRDIRETVAEAGLNPRGIERTAKAIHEQVAQRAEFLGLHRADDRELLLESVLAANRRLGRMATLFERRHAQATCFQRTTNAVARFHRYPEPAKSLASAFSRVARSAGETANARVVIGLLQPRGGTPWHVFAFDGTGEQIDDPRLARFPGRPGGVPDLSDLSGAGPLWSDAIDQIRMMVGEKRVPDTVRPLSLVHGWGPTAVLLTDGEFNTGEEAELSRQALVSVWGACIGGAAQQVGVRRVSEQLAESNRRLGETQAALVEARSMARLGQLAAGAAHEMNNPLTVISGRVQLLARRLREPDNRAAVNEVVRASRQLAHLIDSLHFFAEPPSPDRSPVSVDSIVKDAISGAHERLGITAELLSDDSPDRRSEAPEIATMIDPQARTLRVDPQSMTLALTELIINAIEAQPSSGIEILIQPDAASDRLDIIVTDDGCGLSDRALQHACDPFFSDKPAGRQHGLGLAKASRVAEMHGGRVELVREQGRTRVAIRIADWRCDEEEWSAAA